MVPELVLKPSTPPGLYTRIQYPPAAGAVQLDEWRPLSRTRETATVRHVRPTRRWRFTPSLAASRIDGAGNAFPATEIVRPCVENAAFACHFTGGDRMPPAPWVWYLALPLAQPATDDT